MIRALRVTWSTIVGTYEDLFLLVGANVVWFLLTIPLFLVLFLVAAGTFGTFWGIVAAALLFVVPSPTAGGLYLMTHHMALGEVPPFALFWEGLRRYWRMGLALMGVGLLGFAIIIANIDFYLFRIPESWARVAGVLWLYVLLFWTAAQLYVFPLVVDQGETGLWPIYKKAGLLALANPGFSAVLLAALALVLALSGVALLLFPLLTMSFIARLRSQALQSLLEKYGRVRPEPAE